MFLSQYKEKDVVMARDILQPFYLAGPQVRGRMVCLDGALKAILAGHGYPERVEGLLAEAVTLSALLAGMLKFAGVFTLQVRGDGPVSLLVAQVTNDGHMRAYARFDEAVLAGVPENLAGLCGQGDMLLSLDPGEDGMERYQGVVALEGETLAACTRHYFQQSEQVDTDFAIHSVRDGDGVSSGGIMIQRLPREGGQGEGDAAAAAEDWRRVGILLSTVRAQELVSKTLSPSEVVFRLFHEEDPTFHPEMLLEAKCRCSHKRVLDMLKAMPEEERPGAGGEEISVTCSFCGKTYTFSKKEI